MKHEVKIIIDCDKEKITCTSDSGSHIIADVLRMEAQKFLPRVKIMIMRISDEIDRNDFQRAKNYLSELIALIGRRHPEVIRLETLIAMLED